MAEKRHNERKHPKMTTTQQDGRPICIGFSQMSKTNMSNCSTSDETGGGVKESVRRRDARRGSGKVPSSSASAVVLHPQHNDPHHGEHVGDEQRLTEIVPHRFNAAPSPTLDRSFTVRRVTEARLSSHVNSNPTLGDALLPYIARNLLLAKLAPLFGNSHTNSRPEKMDVIVPKRHKSDSKTKHASEESPRKHRHHNHRSDGELEMERVKAKIRVVDKSKERDMERSSSDRGKGKVPSSPKEKEKKKEKMASQAVERIRTEESDREREERRRRRREKKLQEEKWKEDVAAAILQRSMEVTNERKREQKSSRKEKERKEKVHDSDRSSSSKADKDKQLILSPERKDSSKIESVASTSSSPRRKSTKEHEKHKESDKEKGKENALDKGKSPLLGFILEKKEKMVKCISCLSDDVPRHQAAKLPCAHYFCHECLKRIFHLSLTDPAHMPPKCCTKDHIPLKHVDRLLSYQTKKLWNKKYAEYTTANRIYCPTRDCGEWIQPRDIIGKIGRCSRCKGKVCTMCNGKAHGLKDCPKDEDLKAFVETAKKNGYQRCYSCRAVVELERGCNHITCRCTAEFCYLCGDKWKTCDCPWFAYPDSEDEDEESDNAAPAWFDDEVANTRNRQVTVQAEQTEQMEQVEQTEQREQREQREREAQIARDEALARRLAQASLSDDDDMDDTKRESVSQISTAGPVGSLRTGLRKTYKKLADEYAEASRRDEEAREQRVQERLQKLRDRDEAIRNAKRESLSSQREARPERTHRRHSEPQSVTRPSTSSGQPSLAKAARVTMGAPSSTQQEEETVRRHFLDDERAARIAKYIMGELDELDDSDIITSPLHPTAVPAVAESSTGVQRTHTERIRRATTSEVSPRTARTTRTSRRATEPLHLSRSNSTSKASSGLPRSMARSDHPIPAAHYAASSSTSGNNTSTYTKTKTNDKSMHKARLADLSYNSVQQQPQAYSTHHEKRPMTSSGVYMPPPMVGPTYTAYTYSQYGNSGPYTQAWGGMEAMGSRWREPFLGMPAVPLPGRY